MTGAVSTGTPVLDDTTQDTRFGGELALGPLPLRSCAGVPLHGPTGHVVGTLCALDVRVRRCHDTDLAALADLARWAEHELAREEVERRRAADARAVADMKDEILSLVSHELRTPLTSLQGALGLLAGGVVGGLSPSGQQVAEIALASTERLVALVDDICDLERLAAGQVSVRRRPESLVAVVRAAVEAVTPLSARTSVVLREQVQPTTAWLDGGRVAQVLGHLLRTAVQASSPGAQVVVRGWSTEDVVVPGTDGPATFRLLQADPLTADLPVVMLTARADRADRLLWLEMGVRAALAKPFDPLDLPRQVGAVLGWPA